MTGTRQLRACADDPKKASAKVGRCFWRLRAHDLIVKIPRTRYWRVASYGRKVMGTSLYLREHHCPLHPARYPEQVEKHFRGQPKLGLLVEPLGISVAQMDRICRTQLRYSALNLSHQRLLLEAKRELDYTTLQARQMSDALGFSDPAYFTRFFRRLTGQSRRQWRESRLAVQ